MPEENTSQLPAVLSGLSEDVSQVEAKLAKAKALGAEDKQLEALQGALLELKAAAIEAIKAEADKEIEDAGKKAAVIAGGETPPGVVAPGGDQLRIQAAEEEIQRIKDKLEKAKELGADPGRVEDVAKKLPGVQEGLGKAALAAARNELKKLKEEIRNIAKGKDKAPEGSDKGPGPKPPPTGGGGGGGGGIVSFPPMGIFGIPDAPGAQGYKPALEDPVIVYVRSEKTVWAWSRYDQAWIEQRFSTDLIDVVRISGGLLAYARNGAALWDADLGRWLAPLDSAPEELQDLEGG